MEDRPQSSESLRMHHPVSDFVGDPPDLGSTEPVSRRLSRRTLLAWAGSTPWAGLAGCADPVPALRVGSIAFAGYELMFLARELGLLPERVVRLVEMRSNTDAMRALAAGQLEAAALTMDEMLTARAEGIDLRAILVLDVSAGADVVMGRPPLKHPADLLHHRIGVEDGAGGAIMLGAVLEAGRLKIDQVHKVPLTLDRSVELYRAGLVDAVVAADPWAGQLEALGAVRLFDSTAIPGRIVDVLAARADSFDTFEYALRQLVSAQFEALALLRSHPDQAYRLVAPRLRDVSLAGMGQLFKGLQLPDAADNRAMLRPGGSLHASVRKLVSVMVHQSLLRRPIPLDDVLDDRFLPRGLT